MKLKEVEEKYRDEWVLAEVLKEDESGEPTEVKVIAHSKNRDDTYDAMKKVNTPTISIQERFLKKGMRLHSMSQVKR